VEGKMDFLFPYENLEPLREQLLQVFIGEQFGLDLEWEDSLTKKIISTNVNIQAEINGRPTSMQDIANLEVGSTIMMQNLVDDDINIICNGAIVTNGKLGRMGNKIAISINKTIEEFKREHDDITDISCIICMICII
jgi:flagellar motor switch protein FliM